MTFLSQVMLDIRARKRRGPGFHAGWLLISLSRVRVRVRVSWGGAWGEGRPWPAVDPAAGSTEAPGSRAARKGSSVSDAEHPWGWRGRPRKLRRPSGGDHGDHPMSVMGWWGCAGRWALWLRTGWVVVRRKVRRVPSSRSTVMVCSATSGHHGVGVVSAEGEFLPGDGDDPGVRAPRWAVTGSTDGQGGGPAGRAPRRRRAWW